MQTRSDLRLLIIGLAIWSGAALVGLATPKYFVLVLPLGAWLFGWHRTVAPLIVVAIITGGLLMAIRLHALHQTLITPLLDSNKSVVAIVSIRSDPALGQPKNEGGYIKPASTTALVSAISVTESTKRYSLHLPLRLTTSEQVHWLPGSVVSCHGIFYSTAERKVAALFAVRGRCSLLHGASEIGRLTGALRSDFRSISLGIGSDAGALLPGLVLGDTSLESAHFKNEMLLAGLTHLTAVSGENFAILAAFLSWLLQWFIKKARIRLIINATVLIGFIFLVRPSPSVLRATVRVGVMMLGQAKGVRGTALTGLGGAIAILIFLDPFEATDPGFALSVAATAGILLGQRPLAQILAERLRYQPLAELLAIPLAANLFCIPISIAISGIFSCAALPANILVEPVIAPLTIVGFIAALLAPLWPEIGYLLLSTQRFFAEWISIVAHYGANLPALALPKGWAGAGVGLSGMAIVWVTLQVGRSLRLR